MKNRLFLFLLPGWGIVTLLLFIVVQAGWSAQGTAPVQLSPTALNYCDQRKAEDDARPPQSKPEMSEEAYQECVAALTQAPKTNVLKPEETPLPTRTHRETRPRRIAGNGILIEGHLGMREPRVFLQTNAWYEKSGDRFIHVYAGVKRNASPDLSHSAVAVIVTDLAGNGISEGEIIYEAPVQAGELTILDASGEMLILSTIAGDTLFFDVPSRSFISPDAGTLAAAQQRKAGPGVLIEKRCSPFDHAYEIINQWYQETNGERISVFVGQTQEKGAGGVVLVTTSQGEPTNTTPVETYSVPGYAASDGEYLRIFMVNEDKVTLVGKRGAAYVFDLTTRTFLTPSEAAKLPEDPALLALEASFEKRRADASSR